MNWLKQTWVRHREAVTLAHEWVGDYSGDDLEFRIAHMESGEEIAVLKVSTGEISVTKVGTIQKGQPVAWRASASWQAVLNPEAKSADADREYPPGSVCFDVYRGSRKLLMAGGVLSVIPRVCAWTSYAMFKQPPRYQVNGFAERVGDFLDNANGALQSVYLLSVLRAEGSEGEVVLDETYGRGQIVERDSQRRAIDDPGDPDADPPIPRGENTRAKLLRALIEACHARNIQVFAGYEVRYQGPGSGNNHNAENFHKMLASADADAANGVAEPGRALFEHHALRIQQKLKQHALDFDGVGFDIETAKVRPHHKALFEWFYPKLAEHLGPTKEVAYACAAMIAPETGWRNNVYDAASRLDYLNAQPFDLCLLARNIVAQPMVYDGGKKPSADDLNAVWRYAIHDLGLERHQLQMGLKHRRMGQNSSVGSRWDNPTIPEMATLVSSSLAGQGVSVIVFALEKMKIEEFQRLDAAYDNVLYDRPPLLER